MIYHAPIFLRSVASPLLAVALALSLVGDACAQSDAQFRDRAPELQQLVGQVVAQLEQSYDGDSTEFARQHKRLGAAIKAWNASPRSDVDFELMTGWLRAAIEASRNVSRRSLPPLPQFSDSTPAVPEPPATPSAAESIAETVVDSSPSEPEAVTTPGQSTTESAEPTESVAARRRRYAERISNGLAPIYRAVESQRRSGFGITDRESSSEPPATKDLAATTEPNDAPAEPVRPREVRRAKPSPARSAETIAVQQHEAAARMASAPPPSAELDDPFRDDPLPTEEPEPLPQPARRRVALRPRPQAPAQPQRTPINLAELRARIVGYDRGLRTVEARLMDTEPLSAGTLNQLARALDELIEQHEFLALYWGTLSRSERTGLPTPHSAEPAVQLLSERIVEERHALRRRSASQDSDDGRRDMLLLQEASRRLTKLGGNTRPD